MTEQQNKPQAENEIEPWDDPVNDDCVTEAIRDLQKHVFLDETDAIIAVVWLMHSMIFDTGWDKSPRLMITAPMKQCGKSTLLNVLQAMADRAIEVGSITPAAYVALSSRENQVFFIDEADLTFGRKGDNDMIRVLNTGYERGKPYIKMKGEGSAAEPVKLGVYSAACLAGIGLETRVPEATLSRCIVIRMKRAKKHQLPDKYRRKFHEQKFRDHARKLKRWVHEHEWEIKNQEIDLGVDDDRIEDNFEPLMQIAKTYSDALGFRVKQIAQSVDGSTSEDDLGLTLIRDLQRWKEMNEALLAPRWTNNVSDKGIGAEAARMAVISLYPPSGDVDNPWQNFHPDRIGEARWLTAYDVTRMLRDYAIGKKSIRSGTSLKAFSWSDIDAAYQQYAQEDTPPEYVPGEDWDEPCGRVVSVVTHHGAGA